MKGHHKLILANKIKNHSKINIKGLVCIAFLIFFTIKLSLGKDTPQLITLKNSSSIELKSKAISVSRKLIPNVPKELKYPVIISSENDTIPSQLDDLDGDGNWDVLFFVADLKAKEKNKFKLLWVNEKPIYPVKTSVRFGKRTAANSPVNPSTEEIVFAKDLPKNLGYQKYQTDGPSWENDKVAFRHYLDGRNSKDFFGKKISGITPENVGLNAKREVMDNYHVMEDWGRDVLSVGNSVGIGGYGLKENDNLFRLGVTTVDTINNIEKTIFKIIEEGPVRSILKYEYINWKPDNRNYHVDEVTSIWPGMYGYKNSVKISNLKGDEELVIGLVNNRTKTQLSEIFKNNKYVVLYTHDKQTYDKDWWLGLALILPRNVYNGFISAPSEGHLTDTFLAKIKLSENTPVEYYAVACWELADKGFAEREYFSNYLENLSNQLAAEVKIKVK